jgi:F-type H+-transporting ATPase subunit epsilon
MQVEVVSPERILYSGEATMVVARTTDGDIGFLANHAPFIGALGIGLVSVHFENGTVERIAVHGGFVEVSDNRVTILSDVAELPDQIDVRRAEEAKARAEADLARLPADEQAEAQAALRRAEVRLELGRAA